MRLSARNQFSGRVKEVKLGPMVKMVVDIGGGHEVVAITRGSADNSSDELNR